MTLAAEFVLTKPAIRIPERLARPSLLDYLPPKTTRSLIHILGTLDLMAAALGSSGEVQAAPLQPALNPDHVAHYFDPSLPVSAPPDSIEPQGLITSVDCPPLPVAGGYEINYQPPIVTCDVVEYENQNVLQFDILPPNRQGVYMINPTPGYLVITSNIPDFYPFTAFYTNYKQHTLSTSQIGEYLFQQDRPVIMQINGRDVAVKAKGMDVIVRYEGDNIVFEDGTMISYIAFIRQMFISSGLDPDEYDLGATIQAPMIAVSTEVTDLFKLHSEVTATPTVSIWETTVTPAPSFTNPIQATATIGPVTELGPDGQPTGKILDATVEAPFPIENPQPPITGLLLDMTSLDGKIMVTHANEDTRNPIDSSAIDEALLQLDTANDPQTMIQLGETITAASGSHFDQWLANIRAGGKDQLHHRFLHEKVVAKDLGQIQIKAAYVDQNHLAHFVGHDSRGNWIFFNLTRSELKSIYKKHPDFAQTLTTTGTNSNANEIVRTMLTQKVQDLRDVYIMPEQFVLAGSRADTWSSAWHAATAQGSVICYVTDTTPSPEYAILASCPVDTPIKPDGLYFDSFGSPYLIGTISDNTSGNYTVHSGQIVILDPRNLISDHDQPESEQFSWSAWWDKVTGK